MVHILGKKFQKKKGKGKSCPKVVVIYFKVERGAESYAYVIEFPDEILNIFTADSLNPIDTKVLKVDPATLFAKKVCPREVKCEKTSSGKDN